jgi:hypothetical protein
MAVARSPAALARGCRLPFTACGAFWTSIADPYSFLRVSRASPDRSMVMEHTTLSLPRINAPLELSCTMIASVTGLSVSVRKIRWHSQHLE